ncbi:tRNA (N6-threonylcarbamoyladenosine(37)-N6)-methyltransferase TrmO [Moraxella oblonga]|uniref:tRNA (N6-threonylcarbamoyladenosine(37)-N6)-methyltransferase TrmO n=1 Tax=Moraxella oblonga TaxID=200413 RepID=UPI0008301293|nr:tRNA (N6-threonylcarbamoyladenosine(37)-N6)-methyltransferase TrmO [Moraxella oblonga]
MNTHTLPIIGHHRSPLSQKFGMPRQPNLVAIKSHIEFTPPFDVPDAFVGIEQYSHLWVLWLFHHNKEQAGFRPQVRPPRLGGNDKIGVFATRSMYRPSRVGLSVVAFDRLEIKNNKVILHITGADMIDGTPILDIKPYITFADSLPHATSFDIPTVRSVIMTPQAKQDFVDLSNNNQLNQYDKQIINHLIAQDPRPAYRQHETDIVCAMRYKAVDVDFCMNGDGELVIMQLRAVKNV